MVNIKRILLKLAHKPLCAFGLHKLKRTYTYMFLIDSPIFKSDCVYCNKKGFTLSDIPLGNNSRIVDCIKSLYEKINLERIYVIVEKNNNCESFSIDVVRGGGKLVLRYLPTLRPEDINDMNDDFKFR